MIELKPRDIWKRTDFVEETGCWLYRGCADSVLAPIYPRHWLEVVYAGTHGPIPEGHIVRHTCGNPNCANPDHMYLVDMGERD